MQRRTVERRRGGLPVPHTAAHGGVASLSPTRRCTTEQWRGALPVSHMSAHSGARRSCGWWPRGVRPLSSLSPVVRTLSPISLWRCVARGCWIWWRRGAGKPDPVEARRGEAESGGGAALGNQIRWMRGGARPDPMAAARGELDLDDDGARGELDPRYGGTWVCRIRWQGDREASPVGRVARMRRICLQRAWGDLWWRWGPCGASELDGGLQAGSPTSFLF